LITQPLKACPGNAFTGPAVWPRRSVCAPGRRPPQHCIADCFSKGDKLCDSPQSFGCGAHGPRTARRLRRSGCSHLDGELMKKWSVVGRQSGHWPLFLKFSPEFHCSGSAAPLQSFFDNLVGILSRVAEGIGPFEATATGFPKREMLVLTPTRSGRER